MPGSLKTKSVWFLQERHVLYDLLFVYRLAGCNMFDVVSRVNYRHVSHSCRHEIDT